MKDAALTGNMTMCQALHKERAKDLIESQQPSLIMRQAARRGREEERKEVESEKLEGGDRLSWAGRSH